MFQYEINRMLEQDEALADAGHQYLQNINNPEEDETHNVFIYNDESPDEWIDYECCVDDLIPEQIDDLENSDLFVQFD